MRILLTGVSGQIGGALRVALAPLGDVIAPTRGAFDLARPETLSTQLEALAPDLIVNPAAYTAVDLAESEAARAHCINAGAPRALAAAARALAVPLVHYSTDYVFDGTKSGAYVETDAPNPLGVYAASKLAGERAVADEAATYLILRTGWVYDLRGRNFLRAIRKRAREGARLRVVDDQFGAPNPAHLLAAASVQVIVRWLARPDPARDSGVYHLACTGRASWYDFAAAILEHDAAHGLPHPGLDAIASRDYPTVARRPPNSQLDCARLETVFGIRLPHWREALAACLTDDTQ